MNGESTYHNEIQKESLMRFNTASSMHLILILLLALGLAACGSDGGASSGGDEEDAGAGTDTAAPQFNYIPLNDEACEVEKAPSIIVAQAEQVLTDLITMSDNYVDTQLEVCTEPPTNRCPGCAIGDNPMGDLLDDFSGPLSDYIAQFTDKVDLTRGLKEYFRAALKFPLRFVVVSVTPCVDLGPGACPEGADTRVVLTQGKRQPTGGTTIGSTHYSIEPESLDKPCMALPMALYGTRVVTSDTDTEQVVTVTCALVEEAVDDVNFGFVVPIIKNMPPDDEAITMTDEVLDAWLDELSRFENSLNIRVREPIVTVTMATDKVSGETIGCGRIEGWVDAVIFTDIVAKEAPLIEQHFIEDILPKYQDPEHPDYVYGVLSLEMDSGSFTNGIACKPNPCDKTTGTCQGDLLNLVIETATCALPKPDVFIDGASIEPVCGVSESADWTLDCAQVGGACEAGACTVEWVAPLEGELILTELYDGADGNGDGEKTWVELTNISDHALELNGCYVQARPDGALGHKFTIRGEGPIVVGPGKTYLIGGSADPAENGGIEPDYLKGDDTNFMGSMARAYRMTCDEIIIDEVVWVDWTLTPFVALQLSTEAFDAAANDAEASWCEATATFGDEGGLGTPSAPNAVCP